MIKKRDPGRLPKALLETAADMRRAGVMDAAGREKIVLRLEGARLVRPVEDLDDGTLKAIAASEVPPGTLRLRPRHQMSGRYLPQ